MDFREYFKRNPVKLTREEWQEVELEGKKEASRLRGDMFAAHDTTTNTFCFPQSLQGW